MLSKKQHTAIILAAILTCYNSELHYPSQKINIVLIFLFILPEIVLKMSKLNMLSAMTDTIIKH